MSEPKITELEFRGRFTAQMIKVIGEKDVTGGSVAEYADEMVGNYFEEYVAGGYESPEEAADTDISYWEE